MVGPGSGQAEAGRGRDRGDPAPGTERGRPARRSPGGAGRGSAAVPVALALALSTCARGEPLEVVSALPAELLDRFEEAYEAATPGVDLRIRRMSDAEARAAVMDGEASFDVWLGAPRSDLSDAARAGRVRDDWVPVLSSPVVLAVNRDTVPLTRAPRDWIDLFHPRWNDEVVLADPAGSPAMREIIEGAWLEELRRTGDARAGADWLLKLDGVSLEYDDDEEEVMRSLRTGRASLALVPLYRVLGEAEEGGLAWRALESGGPSVVRGAAIGAASSRVAAAEALLAHVRGPGGRDLAEPAGGWLPAGGGDADLPAGVVRERLLGRRVWTWDRDAVAERGPGWIETWRREVKDRGRERLLP